MISRILIFCALFAATAAPAATVQIELPSTTGNHLIDLGVPLDRVISVSLNLAGTAQDHYYHCQNDYPDGPVEYDYWDSTHVWVALASDGAFTDNDWYTPNGEFDETIPLPIDSSNEYVLFADGTATFTLEMWVELFPPYSDDCGLEEAGFVDLAGPIIMTMEYEGPTPVTASRFGSVKALYR